MDGVLPGQAAINVQDGVVRGRAWSGTRVGLTCKCARLNRQATWAACIKMDLSPPLRSQHAERGCGAGLRANLRVRMHADVCGSTRQIRTTCIRRSLGYLAAHLPHCKRVMWLPAVAKPDQAGAARTGGGVHVQGRAAPQVHACRAQADRAMVVLACASSAKP